MAQQVLGAVGAAVGFIYGGGAQGAQWGWMIGSAIGSAVDPTVLPGPRIGEIAQQTSQEGVPRPIVFALSPPIPGNIIDSSEPKIVRRKESQDKGGPKVETESVYRTYATRVCEGPITRFARVWRNGILVYDVLNDSLDPSQNDEFLKTARFFVGGWDQQPSPDLESLHGVGTTPSYRGTAYMVMADEDLTDLRGAIPQYVFQVERCEGLFLTSRPYAIEIFDAVDIGGAPRAAALWFVEPESVAIGGAPLDSSLVQPLVTYDNYEPESVDIAGAPLDGTLVSVVLDYDNYDPESVDIGGSPLDSTLVVVLVSYDEYEPESVDIGGAPLNSTLA